MPKRVEGAPAEDESAPGAELGLPASGRGSLAGWGVRIGALVVDWGACMLVALGLFGTGVMVGQGWRAWMTLTIFFLESSILGAIASGSFGQLVCRIAVVRLDRQPLGIVRATVRAALVSLVLPALIIGVHRRGLHDMAVGTVVVNRR